MGDTLAYEKDTNLDRDGMKKKLDPKVNMSDSEKFKFILGNTNIDLAGKGLTHIAGSGPIRKNRKNNANTKVDDRHVNKEIVEALNAANFYGLHKNTPLSHTAIHGFSFNYQQQKGRRSSTIDATVKAWTKVSEMDKNKTGQLFAFDLETFGATSSDNRWNPAGITEFAMRQYDFATGNTVDTNILFTNEQTLNAIEKQLKEYKKFMESNMSMQEMKEKHNDVYVTAMRMSLYDPARGAKFEQVNGVWQATALVATEEAEAGNIGSVMNAFDNFKKMKLEVNEETGLTADVEMLIKATNQMNAAMETGNGVVMGHNIINFDRPILSKQLNDIYRQQLEIYADKSLDDKTRQQAYNALQLFRPDKDGYVGFNFDGNTVLDTLAAYRAARDELGIEFGSLQLEELTKQYMPHLLDEGVAHLGINDVRNNIAIVLDKLPELNDQSPFGFIMHEANKGVVELNQQRPQVQITNRQLFKANGNVLTPNYGGKGFLNYRQYDTGEIYTSGGYHIKDGKIRHTDYAGNTGFTKGAFYKVDKQERIEISKLPKELRQQILDTYPEYNGKYIYHASFKNEGVVGSIQGHTVNVFATSQDEMESLIGSTLSHVANQGDDGEYEIVQGKKDEILTATYKFKNKRVYKKKQKKKTDTQIVQEAIKLGEKQQRNEAAQRAMDHHDKFALRVEGVLKFDKEMRKANLGDKLDAMKKDKVSLSEVLVGDGEVNGKKYFNKKEMKKINASLKRNLGYTNKDNHKILDERTKINIAEEYNLITDRKDYYENLLQVTKERLGTKEIDNNNATQATKFFKELDKKSKRTVVNDESINKAREAKNQYTNTQAYFKNTYDFKLGKRFDRVGDKAQLINDIWTTDRTDDIISLNIDSDETGAKFLTKLYNARMGHKANQKNLSQKEIDYNKNQAFYSFLMDLNNNKKKNKLLFQDDKFREYVENLIEVREETGLAPEDFDANVGVKYLLNAAKGAKDKNLAAGILRSFGDTSVFDKSKNMTKALNNVTYEQMKDLGKDIGVTQYYHDDKSRKVYVDKLVDIFGIDQHEFETKTESLTPFEKKRAQLIRDDIQEKLRTHFDDLLKASDEHGISYTIDELNGQLIAEQNGRGLLLSAMPQFKIDEHGIIHMKSGGNDVGVALRLAVKTVNGEQRTYLTTNFDESFGRKDFFQQLFAQRKRDTGGIDLTDINRSIKLHNKKTKEFTGYTGSKNDLSVLNSVFDLSSIYEMYYEMFREGGSLNHIRDQINFNNPEIINLYREQAEKFKDGNVPPDLFMAGISDFINIARATLDPHADNYEDILFLLENAGASIKETKLVEGLVQLGSRVVGNYTNNFDNVGRPPMTGAGNVKQIRVSDIEKLKRFGISAGSTFETEETLRGIFRESAGIELTSDFRGRQAYVSAPTIQTKLSKYKENVLINSKNIDNATIKKMTDEAKEKVYDRMIETMTSGTYEQARVIDGRIFNNIIDMPIDTSYISINKDIIGSMEEGATSEEQFSRLLGLIGNITYEQDADGNGQYKYTRRAGTMVRKGEVIAKYKGYGNINRAIGSKYDLGVMSYSIRTKEDKDLTDEEISAFINQYAEVFDNLNTDEEKAKALVGIMDSIGLKSTYKIENVNQASIFKVLDQGTEKGMSLAMSATIGEYDEDVKQYFTEFKELAKEYGLDEKKYDFTNKVVAREKAIKAAHEDLVDAMNKSGDFKNNKKVSDLVQIIDARNGIKKSTRTFDDLMKIVTDERDVMSEMAFGEFGAYHGFMGIVNDAIPKHANLGVGTSAGFGEAVYQYAKAKNQGKAPSVDDQQAAREELMNLMNKNDDINFIRTTYKGSTVQSTGKNWTMGKHGVLIADRDEDEFDFIDDTRFTNFMKYTNDLIEAINQNVDEDDKLVHEKVYTREIDEATGKEYLKEHQSLVGSFQFETVIENGEVKKVVVGSNATIGHSIVNDGETISGVTQEYIDARKQLAKLKQKPKEDLTEDDKILMKQLRDFIDAENDSVKFMKLDSQGVAIMQQTRFNDALAEDLGASVKLQSGREKNFTKEKAEFLTAKTGEYIRYNSATGEFSINEAIKGRNDNQVWLEKARQSRFYNEIHGAELTKEMIETPEYEHLGEAYKYMTETLGAEKVGIHEATNFYDVKGLAETVRFNRGQMTQADIDNLVDNHNFEVMKLSDYVSAEGSAHSEVIGSIANKRIVLDLGDEFREKDRYVAIPSGGMIVGDQEALKDWQGKINHLKKLQDALDMMEGGGKLKDNFFYKDLSKEDQEAYLKAYGDIPQDLIDERNELLGKIVEARQDIVDSVDKFNQKDGAFTRISKIEITDAQERLKILSITSTSATNEALKQLGVKHDLELGSETFMKTAKIMMQDGEYKSLHELSEMGIYYDAERVGRDYFERAGYFEQDMLDQMGFTDKSEMEQYLREHGTMRNVTRYPQILRGSIYNTRIYLDDNMNGKNGISVMAHSMLKYLGDSDGDSESGFNVTIDGTNFAIYERQRELAIKELKQQGNTNTGVLFERDVKDYIISKGIMTEDAFIGFRDMSLGMDLAAATENQGWAEKARQGTIDDITSNIKVGKVGGNNYQIKDAVSDTFKNSRFEAITAEVSSANIQQNVSDVKEAVSMALSLDPSSFDEKTLDIAQQISDGKITISDVRGADKYTVLDHAMLTLEQAKKDSKISEDQFEEMQANLIQRVRTQNMFEEQASKATKSAIGSVNNALNALKTTTKMMMGNENSQFFDLNAASVTQELTYELEQQVISGKKVAFELGDTRLLEIEKILGKAKTGKGAEVKEDLNEWMDTYFDKGTTNRIWDRLRPSVRQKLESENYIENTVKTLMEADSNLTEESATIKAKNQYLANVMLDAATTVSNSEGGRSAINAISKNNKKTSTFSSADKNRSAVSMDFMEGEVMDWINNKSVAEIEQVVQNRGLNIKEPPKEMEAAAEAAEEATANVVQKAVQTITKGRMNIGLGGALGIAAIGVGAGLLVAGYAGGGHSRPTPPVDDVSQQRPLPAAQDPNFDDGGAPGMQQQGYVINIKADTDKGAKHLKRSLKDLKKVSQGGNVNINMNYRTTKGGGYSNKDIENIINNFI